MNIQEVVSPGGISAWLVEEHRVPLVAIRFAFAGGTAQDPAEKPGVANFVSVMLDEGAGSYDAQQFQERQEELAMRIHTDGADKSKYADQSYVSKIELGQANITLETIEQIAKALECEVGELF